MSDPGDDRSREALLEELERRSRELELAQSIAKVGSWDFAASGGLRWSDELFRLLGAEPQSFAPTADSLLERVHPEDLPTVEAAYAAMTREGLPMAFDVRVRPEPGEPVRWVRIRGQATLGDDGILARASGTVQDVTESKEAEQGLAFLSAMAAAANDAPTLEAALLAADTIVRPYTQWPAVIVSAPDPDRPGELVHFPAGWRDYGEDAMGFAHEMAAEAAASAGLPDRPDLVQRTGPGGTVFVAGRAMLRDRIACIIVSDSRAASAPRAYELAIFRQMLTLLAAVAQREEVAGELESARDEALAASRAKSDFLATMSHEIRTPLNGVIGLSELLGREDLSPHQRRFADGIEQAGRSLLALVNDILDLSKIEAGRLDLEDVDFDPRDVVERSVALLAEAAAAKGLELVVSSVDQVPALVRGDPVRLGQVVTNLVSNAVKFTQSGEVVVRASGAGPTGLRVDVTDTGIGIDPAGQSRLFAAFTQADSSTTRRYGGTGLGLAISQRIVQAMGGEIGVDSELGAGSTFWFTAPFGAPAGPDVPAVAHGAVAGLRVLVVDDNETNRFILAEQLRAWGVQVTVAADAREALAEIDGAGRRGVRYDVALLDYMMPGLDGEQLARAIRADDRFAGVRIALLSSAIEPSATWLARAGVDRFVAKPVLASRLLDELAVLGGRVTARSATGGQRMPATDEERGRVLVVEDNAVNQLVATGLLRHLGFEVVIAEDGARGVAAVDLDPHGYDVVLMDCQMPVMDGYDATRAIRALPDVPAGLPILAMTASATAEEQQRCRDAGMDDFLPKPVDPAELARVLDHWAPAGAARPAHPSVPPPQESAPAKRIRELMEDGFDAALVLQIVDRFGTSAEQTLAELDAAVAAGDEATVGDKAHRLRGSADNVGLSALAEECRLVERRARAGELPDRATLDGLRAALDRALGGLDHASRPLR